MDGVRISILQSMFLTFSLPSLVKREFITVDASHADVANLSENRFKTCKKVEIKKGPTNQVAIPGQYKLQKALQETLSPQKEGMSCLVAPTKPFRTTCPLSLESRFNSLMDSNEEPLFSTLAIPNKTKELLHFASKRLCEDYRTLGDGFNRLSGHALLEWVKVIGDKKRELEGKIFQFFVQSPYLIMQGQNANIHWNLMPVQRSIKNTVDVRECCEDQKVMRMDGQNLTNAKCVCVMDIFLWHLKAFKNKTKPTLNTKDARLLRKRFFALSFFPASTIFRHEAITEAKTMASRTHIEWESKFHLKTPFS